MKESPNQIDVAVITARRLRDMKIAELEQTIQQLTKEVQWLSYQTGYKNPDVFRACIAQCNGGER